MTQEEKDLLLKDLCSRLPYEVKVAFYLYVIDDWKTTTLRSINPSEGTYRIGNQDYNDLARIKPYLRPMESMTAEEQKEYELLANHCIVTSIGFIHLEIREIIDWLNAHHFDYRGLIPKSLAIAVTEENNPYKTK